MVFKRNSSFSLKRKINCEESRLKEDQIIIDGGDYFDEDQAN